MMFFYNKGQLLLIFLSCAENLKYNDSIAVENNNLNTTENNQLNPGVSSVGVSGIIVSSEDKKPLSNVTIYIPSYSIESDKKFIIEHSLNSPIVNQPNCIKPSTDYISYTCSRADGSFFLPLSKVTALPLKIFVQKDNRINSTSIDLNEINSDIGVITFSEFEDLEVKDKVAIVFDLLNPYEEISKILTANDINPQFVQLEMLKSFYDIYEIDSNQNEVDVTTLKDLINTKETQKDADITQYDVIYINCHNEDDIANLPDDIKRALLMFVSNGGELYLTSWQFQLPETNLDQYI